jgi:hypothetical protein
MLSGQNQNSYSTLLVEQNSFLSPLYVRAGVSYLLHPTLALHIVPVMAYNAQHRLAELGVIFRLHVTTRNSQHFTALTVIYMASHCPPIFQIFNMVKYNP